MTDPGTCRESALKLLERTRRTRSDLARRLKDKGFAVPAIAEVLDRLVEVGLIDDSEYARAWLAGRWGRRPSGWRRLQQELRAKGIADDDIDSLCRAVGRPTAIHDDGIRRRRAAVGARERRLVDDHRPTVATAEGREQRQREAEQEQPSGLHCGASHWQLRPKEFMN